MVACNFTANYGMGFPQFFNSLYTLNRQILKVGQCCKNVDIRVFKENLINISNIRFPQISPIFGLKVLNNFIIWTISLAGKATDS